MRGCTHICVTTERHWQPICHKSCSPRALPYVRSTVKSVRLVRVTIARAQGDWGPRKCMCTIILSLLRHLATGQETAEGKLGQLVRVERDTDSIGTALESGL